MFCVNFNLEKKTRIWFIGIEFGQQQIVQHCFAVDCVDCAFINQVWNSTRAIKKIELLLTRHKLNRFVLFLTYKRHPKAWTERNTYSWNYSNWTMKTSQENENRRNSKHDPTVFSSKYLRVEMSILCSRCGMCFYWMQ